MKIGDSVWIFDPLLRCSSYRDQWIQHFIIGETSRSWIINPDPNEMRPDEWRSRKIPKNKMGHETGILTAMSEVDEAVWVRENRHYIARQIEWSYDPVTLRIIAELISYEEAK